MKVELRLGETCIYMEETESGDTQKVAITVRAGTNVPGVVDLRGRTIVEMTDFDVYDPPPIDSINLGWGLMAADRVFRITVRGERQAKMLQRALKFAADELGRQMKRNQDTIPMEVD